MKASVFIATSLDGFIARKDGAIDWLPASPEEHGYDEFMASVDALVIGRGTYETVLGFGGWGYGKKPVFVLTSNPSAIKPPEGAVCEAMSGSPREIADALTQRDIHSIYVDGGVTIQRFLEAGLIQRMIVTRIPVLLGSGIPLFGPLSRDVWCKHVTTRSFASGMVQSEYVIEGT
jgi:dihydrofolate reductase